jgi:hypothetical protein
MKNIIFGLIVAVALLPGIVNAQETDLQATYNNLLKTLIELLMKQVAVLQAQLVAMQASQIATSTTTTTATIPIPQITLVIPQIQPIQNQTISQLGNMPIQPTQTTSTQPTENIPAPVINYEINILNRVKKADLDKYDWVDFYFQVIDKKTGLPAMQIGEEVAILNKVYFNTQEQSYSNYLWAAGNGSEEMKAQYKFFYYLHLMKFDYNTITNPTITVEYKGEKISAPIILE